MDRRGHKPIEARDDKGRPISFRAAPPPPPKPRRPRGESLWRPWRKVGILLALGAFFLGGRETLGYLGIRISGGTACRVVRVIDGDTVRIYCPGRGFDLARLIGFDTPEVFSPRCFGEWWAGTKASWALSRHLWTADEVKIVLSGTDRYDRRLATLFVDGRNIAPTMIADGHARPYAGGRREGWC